MPNFRKTSRLFWGFPALVLFLALFFGVGLPQEDSLALEGEHTRPNSVALTSTQAITHTLFFPFVPHNFPWTPPVFGAEISFGMVEETVGKAEDAGAVWIRYRGIDWSNIELEPGDRKWARIGVIEEEFRLLSEHNRIPIVVVYGTPEWARVYPDFSCSPVLEERLDELAAFMYDLVARYSVPPYNIKYWEMWNEPDVDPTHVIGTSVYGCWGDESDPYYGGGVYAQMLQAVYPAVKAADPDSNVVVGGLLLDCDPTDPPAGKSCHQADFFEGILQGGGGDYFDQVAYHAYTNWTSVKTDWDLTHSEWDQRGGVTLGKLDLLRETMANYGYDKPVLLTEAALLCFPLNFDCPGEEFDRDQANYVARLFLRTWAQDVRGVIWYTLDGPGWRDSGMLDEDQNPRPPYDSLKFLANLLYAARFEMPIPHDTLEGYEFSRFQRRYQVYWNNEDEVVSLPLPAETEVVYDIFGQDITPQGELLSVGFEPVIVEMRDE